MVLGALVCINNANFEKKKSVSANIVLDEFIIRSQEKNSNL